MDKFSLASVSAFEIKYTTIECEERWKKVVVEAKEDYLEKLEVHLEYQISPFTFISKPI